METKTVIWIELTSPWEDNMTHNHFLKIDRYNQLAIDLREGRHQGVKWTVHPLYVEVGSRGFINGQPWHEVWSKTLGFTPEERKRLTCATQEAAINCSFAIFLSRFSQDWGERAVLDTYGWAESGPRHSNSACGPKC